VWNLGLAPLIGISVEFLVFDPSIAFTGQTPLFEARSRVDLGGRSAPQDCHKVVKCPKAWVPTVVNNGHECVMARVPGLGDTLQATHEFQPRYERKVGQRNMHLALFGANQQRLLGQLTKSLPKGAELQFFAVGSEAQYVVDLLAPGLRINPSMKTQRISNLNSAPKPATGHATVVRIQGADVKAGLLIGGYTIVFTARLARRLYRSTN
jgi:hypothetical protein